MIIAQVTPSSVPDDPSQWSWYLVALCIGGAVGWGIKALRDKEEIRKLKAEVQKLEAEEIKLAGENLREVQRARDAYSDACTTCGKHGKAILTLLRQKGSESDIQQSRNDYGIVLCQSLLPALCSLTEWQSLSRKSDPSALISYIRSDVVPELKRVRSWIAIINLHVFTETMALAPLRIEERTMRPFFDLMRFVPKDRHGQIREQLFQAIREVTEA